MTRSDALRDLLEAVEAGTVDERDFMSWSTQYGLALLTMEEAYRGSVDAAIAFVEAVLPDWKWDCDSTHDASVWLLEKTADGVWWTSDEHRHTDNHSAGRALGIAALKALIAQEEA